MILRGDMQKHELICPNVIVKCLLYEFGCKTELRRSELDAHMEKNSATHLVQWMEHYKALKADTEEAVKQELK